MCEYCRQLTVLSHTEVNYPVCWHIKPPNSCAVNEQTFTVCKGTPKGLVALNTSGSCSISRTSSPRDVRMVLRLCRAWGLTVRTILNTRMCLLVSEGPCSAASTAGEDGELKPQQTSCLRAPELEQKPSWPSAELAPQRLFD